MASGADVAVEVGVEVGVGDSTLVGADVGAVQASKVVTNINASGISISDTLDSNETSMPSSPHRQLYVHGTQLSISLSELPKRATNNRRHGRVVFKAGDLKSNVLFPTKIG